MTINRSKFFNEVRDTLFRGRINASQVNGIEGILRAFDRYGDGRAKTLAYALATAFHETGSHMVPVREGFTGTDISARRLVARRKYGKPVGPYRHVYYGRGHVQLTWLENYRRTSRDITVDLVKNPDVMLDPVISARVLIIGLLDGRWNKHKKGIAFYLPTFGPDDLKGARRTVNGIDKWELIGGYYVKFYDAIRVSGGMGEAPIPPDVPAPKPRVEAPPRRIGRTTGIAALVAVIVATIITWWDNLVSWVGGLF